VDVDAERESEQRAGDAADFPRPRAPLGGSATVGQIGT